MAMLSPPLSSYSKHPSGRFKHKAGLWGRWHHSYLGIKQSFCQSLEVSLHLLGRTKNEISQTMCCLGAGLKWQRQFLIESEVWELFSTLCCPQGLCLVRVPPLTISPSLHLAEAARYKLVWSWCCHVLGSPALLDGKRRGDQRFSHHPPPPSSLDCSSTVTSFKSLWTPGERCSGHHLGKHQSCPESPMWLQLDQQEHLGEGPRCAPGLDLDPEG